MIIKDPAKAKKCRAQGPRDKRVNYCITSRYPKIAGFSESLRDFKLQRIFQDNLRTNFLA